MLDLLITYWPHLLAAVSIVFGTVAAVHATMTKREVRSALGWVGVIVLSPLIGALIYAVAGINRIRRASLTSRRALRLDELWRSISSYGVAGDVIAAQFGSEMASLKTLGDRVARHPLSSGNRVLLLGTGEETYSAICEAITSAERSVILETYIFDRDPIGLKVADCLIAAHKRGVAVRVLIDAVGARYSVPSIIGYLQDAGVSVAAFNGKVIMGLRLPYANLRTHRKIVVADGTTAFIGGMNIRAAFTGPDGARDTHFRVSGPIVADILAVAAEDWHFETKEVLKGPEWRLGLDGAVAGEPSYARLIVSGPDTHLETNHKMLIGAFSVAQHSIRIMSPYFLPDAVLISALATAARRGVRVDIVVPSRNNLAIVSHAMTAQFDQVLKDGCRVLRAAGQFDHSKLAVIDGRWVFVGSSNLDSRSLRLNFEIDMEIFDMEVAGEIESRIAAAMEDAEEVILDELRARPFLIRLFERFLWLGSPYL
ncbi:phospholipase D-like domain-containing protein [Rhizobium sp. SL42]|uniref:phospholipase D-like domain-containing protein n=1 Tax=Rhizobium sp. SL42 TaxID=2806346 RepID=UPI001F258715|nr:phospholipase D-like domain-containing protein [Rhizobium sp. SL42]UJW74129.1 PLDc N-terminal domain-containing protein [Rhizobium sp. SL42]